MSYRIMRAIIFYDLPTVTVKELSEYRNFRRFLLDNGFVMMQESVYSKIVLNSNSYILLKNQICKNLPGKGIIQIMQITEKQFTEINYLRGSYNNKVINTDQRLIEL